MIIKNGLIMTMDPRNRIIKNGFLSIEDNRISAIGDNAKAPEDDDAIDATGKLIMPGMVNTHTHLAMTLFRGYVDDLAFWDAWPKKIWPREKLLKSEDVYYGSLLGCIELIESGTTTFNDMYFFPEETAKAVEKTGLRSFISTPAFDFFRPENTEKQTTETERVIKNLIALKNERIVPTIGPHAIYSCSEKLLKNVKMLSEKNGVGIHMHVSETKKEVDDSLANNKKTPVKYLDSLGLLNKKTLAAHCCWVDDDDTEILSRKNVSVSHCPVSNMKLASGKIAPVSKLMKAGVNVTLGTDGAVSNNSLDLLETAKFAAIINKHAENDTAVLPAKIAIAMATTNGAKALNLNAGSLEVGKFADIVIMDMRKPHWTPLHDIQSSVVYSGKSSDVDTVICNGKILMKNKVLIDIDKENILERADNAAQDLVTR